MSKLFVLKFVEIMRGFPERNRFGLTKDVGYSIPHITPCPKCGRHNYEAWAYHYPRYYDFSFTCPQEIIDDCELLCDTEYWDIELGSPHFKPAVLWPYLHKWTMILQKKGHNMNGIITPGSTFAPDNFVPLDNRYKNFDMGAFGSCSPPFFVSSRLKKALNECRGVYFRNIEIVNKLHSNDLPQKELFCMKFLEPCFGERTLCRSMQYDYLQQNDLFVVCPKCGCLWYNQEYVEICVMKAQYFAQHGMFPIHLRNDSIDIFEEYPLGWEGIIVSEKAYSILKNFDLDLKSVNELEIVDNPIWFNNDFWKSMWEKSENYYKTSLRKF